ncbi:hypothetical protein JTE90_021797 [Oedothorax gibbosus]|uniref:Uncharacterized protein n=1 Tax=Oedothorax gibbosus TaxID=931172 RepID=A0AAV6TQC2_9ARAC|nr:hypothetical protein JTE90_021797 [Oedothorax gibbosus]
MAGCFPRQGFLFGREGILSPLGPPAAVPTATSKVDVRTSSGGLELILLQEKGRSDFPGLSSGGLAAWRVWCLGLRGRPWGFLLGLSLAAHHKLQPFYAPDRHLPHLLQAHWLLTSACLLRMIGTSFGVRVTGATALFSLFTNKLSNSGIESPNCATFQIDLLFLPFHLCLQQYLRFHPLL